MPTPCLLLQVLLLMEMLNTEPWCYFPLTLQFLSSRVSAERGRCPPPPPHVAVLVAPLEVRDPVALDLACAVLKAEVVKPGRWTWLARC